MRQIPAGYEVLFENTDLNIQVFFNAAKCLAMGYSGRREKKDFFYRYPDLARLTEDTKERFDRKVTELAEAKRRRCGETPLKVGDVLRVSWGHDQTNVDAYKVIQRSGKRKVTLQQIGVFKSCNQGFDDRGICVPDEDRLVGDPFSKMADVNGYVSLESFMAGGLWPKDAAGNYMPCYWSSYA